MRLFRQRTHVASEAKITTHKEKKYEECRLIIASPIPPNIRIRNQDKTIVWPLKLQNMFVQPVALEILESEWLVFVIQTHTISHEYNFIILINIFHRCDVYNFQWNKCGAIFPFSLSQFGEWNS